MQYESFNATCLQIVQETAKGSQPLINMPETSYQIIMKFWKKGLNNETASLLPFEAWKNINHFRVIQILNHNKYKYF